MVDDYPGVSQRIVVLQTRFEGLERFAWARIESLLKAAGCRVIEGAGSSVTFEFAGRKMTLHRPHPGKEALRYRVLAVREFLEKIGVKP